MDKIEVGDIVEVLVQNTAGSYLQKGDQGEVYFIDNHSNDGLWAAVSFSFEFTDAHDCDGKCPNGWWIPITDLKKIC